MLDKQGGSLMILVMMAVGGGILGDTVENLTRDVVLEMGVIYVRVRQQERRTTRILLARVGKRSVGIESAGCGTRFAAMSLEHPSSVHCPDKSLFRLRPS